MSEARRGTLLGGLALVLCPLFCLGLPLLVAAGIGAGLALAVGGAVLGGVALAGLGVGAFVGLRRRRSAEACCTSPERLKHEGSSRADRRLAEVARR